jgi:hypothetical protein
VRLLTVIPRFAVLAATLCLPLTAAAQAPPPAKEIIARYVAAIGGEKAFLERPAWQMTGDFAMPAVGITGTVESYASDGRSFAKVVVPGIGEILRGHDGKVAWSLNPMEGPRLLQGIEAARMAEEASPGAMLRHSSVVTSAETVGKSQVNGEECWNVKIMWKSGRETTECFSIASGLFIGSTGKIESAMGSVDYTMIVTEYKEFGGVKVPGRMVQTAMNQEQIITTRTYSVGPVDNARFALPAEVKALVK